MFKTIKIEPTYGCNLKCSFCAGTYEEKQSPMFMSIETVSVIKKQMVSERLPVKVTVSFSLRGEPTLNPNLIELISVFGKDYRTILATNGTQLTRSYVVELFKAGLDGIHIDVYNEATLSFLKELKKDNLSGVPQVRAYSSETSVWSGNNGIVVCDERKTRDKGTRKLHNWGGALPKELWQVPVKNAVCAEPLKNITIRYDGTYALCCQTWHDKITFGNVREAPILSHYVSQNYRKVISTLLLEGRYNVDACKDCNVFSMYAHTFIKQVMENRL